MNAATDHINQSIQHTANEGEIGLLTDFILHLADNTLILAQRNVEWCGHGPILEQDIALTNISLDLLGQARSFYQYAAELINADPELHSKYLPDAPAGKVTEDTLAYLRTERDFKNCLLAEQPNGDWAKTTLRQFFFSCYQYFFYTALQHCKDSQLAALAVKSLKEVTYHLRWSSEWVIRLGDGTAESHQRTATALDELWGFTGEMFQPAPYEQTLVAAGFAVDLQDIELSWNEKVREILAEATLNLPSKAFMYSGGKTGIHTEHMGYILAEMQYLQRTYPGCQW